MGLHQANNLSVYIFHHHDTWLRWIKSLYQVFAGREHSTFQDKSERNLHLELVWILAIDRIR